MNNYISYDPANGMIVGILKNMTPELAILNKDEGCNLLQVSNGEEANQKNTYVLDDVLVDRPPEPTIPLTWAVGVEIPLGNVTAGAEVTLQDSFGGENSFIYAPDDPLFLTDAGVYSLRIRQPFPYHHITHSIEITNA